jgi:hypothetical protein
VVPQLEQAEDAKDLSEMSSGTFWSGVSVRARTLLHDDDLDGTSTQWSGRKLWVFVKRADAERVGLKQSDESSMECSKTKPLIYDINKWMAWSGSSGSWFSLVRLSYCRRIASTR